MACLKNPEEKKIERLLTVLRTLRNVNRLLAKERNQKKLKKGICNTQVWRKSIIYRRRHSY